MQGPDEVINFVATGAGAYVVISYPKCERFDLPVLGCLYSARLHRQVSVRCPKGAASADLQCDLQVRYNSPMIHINVYQSGPGRVKLRVSSSDSVTSSAVGKH